MADVLIQDIDDAVLERLQKLARSAGISVEELAARLLRAEAEGAGAVASTRALVRELAAMRASQPRQDGDAAADIRDLRDGPTTDATASHAA